LLEDVLQLGAEATRGDVGGAARGERHDDLDRLAREVLRARDTGEREGCGAQKR